MKNKIKQIQYAFRHIAIGLRALGWALAGEYLSPAEWRRKAKVEELRAKLRSIPGEPCGNFKHHCRNPRHLEYWYLFKELIEHGENSVDR